MSMIVSEPMPKNVFVPDTLPTAQVLGGNPEEFEGFLFLPSFRESIDNLMEGTPQLAMELLWAIIIYGTQNKDIAESPAVKAIMASIRRTIDAGKEKRKKAERGKHNS